MTLPPVSKNQQKILALLYTYRFLTRPQIHSLVGNSYRRSINRWLLDLRTKKYIEWQYSTDYIGRTKPASYYLGINGIRWLRAHGYPESELTKRHRDKLRSASFLEICRLVADTALAMRSVTGNERFEWATSADYNTWIGPFDNLKALQPSLVFIRHTTTETGERHAPYVLELLRSTASPLFVRQRLKAYVRYLTTSEEWRESFTIRPTILFVCPDKIALRASRRAAGRLLGKDYRSILFRVATLSDYRQNGFQAGIWAPLSTARRPYQR